MQYGTPLPLTAFASVGEVKVFAEALESAGFGLRQPADM